MVNAPPWVAIPEQQVFCDCGTMAPMAQRRPRRSYTRAISGSTAGLKTPRMQLAVR